MYASIFKCCCWWRTPKFHSNPRTCIPCKALGSASNPISAFRKLFLTDVGFFVRFDQWISVRLPAHPDQQPNRQKRKREKKAKLTQCPCGSRLVFLPPSSPLHCPMCERTLTYVSSTLSVQWMDLAGDYGWHLGSLTYLLKVHTSRC